MSQILERLYLGGYSDAKDLKKLEKLGITHIAAIAAEAGPYFQGCFSYLHIKAYDSSSFKLFPWFEEVANFIYNALEKENGVVLVHCQMGISRSASCVIAYLMKYYAMSFRSALQFVQSKRTIVCPNEGFQQQLIEFEKTRRIAKDSRMSSSGTQQDKRKQNLEEQKKPTINFVSKNNKPSESIDKTVLRKSIQRSSSVCTTKTIRLPILLRGSKFRPAWNF